MDDVPENLLALEAALACPSYQLVLRRSGEEALAYLLTRHNCSLILLDVCMPGIDGYETAELIQQSSNRYIPIVFISAIYREHQHLLRGLRAGALDYIPKPFEPESLKLKVARLVEINCSATSTRHELESDREQAADLFLHAPVPVLVTEGPEHKVRLANGGWSSLSGGPVPLGQSARDTFAELRGSGLFERLDEVFRSGQRYEGKAALLSFRHRPAALDLLCEPWFDVAGKVERIVVLALDVTARLVARRRLLRLARGLAGPALRVADPFQAA